MVGREDPYMTNPAALTPADRVRLRPTVDTEALERFLAAIPDDERAGVRRAAVLHFSRTVTAADIHEFLMDIGNVEAANALEHATETALDDLPEPEVHHPTQPDALAHQPIPTVDQLFQMDPPDSPRLRALWDAIEPTPLASG
jgi:hypothetical protein